MSATRRLQAKCQQSRHRLAGSDHRLGISNESGRVRRPIPSENSSANTQGAQIHSFGIAADGQFGEFLQDVACESGGSFAAFD